MAYASTASILTIIPDLPQSTSSQGWSISTQTIDRHITRADSIVNGKISKRYAVPITPTPPTLATLSEDITAWMTMRSFYTQDNHNQYDHFEVMSEQAFLMLEQIRNGEVDLFDTSGSLIGENAGTVSQSLVDSNNIDLTPVFGMDDVLNQRVDPDLIDKLAGEK